MYISNTKEIKYGHERKEEYSVVMDIYESIK